MARLEYTILAEFAKVDEAGLLTVVGGGFRGVEVSDPAAVMPLQIAAEVRMRPDEGSTNLLVRVQAESGDFTTEIRTTVELPSDAVEIDGEVAAPVALVMPPIPLAEPGVYRLLVSVADSNEPAKALSFVVNHVTQESDG